jgi:kinesin family protein C2/C3
MCSLTRITIRRHGANEEVSKLWLIDLGGSEWLLKTSASGLTTDEGKAITLSLSALGDVIAALRRMRSHVPYR